MLVAFLVTLLVTMLLTVLIALLVTCLIACLVTCFVTCLVAFCVTCSSIADRICRLITTCAVSTLSTGAAVSLLRTIVASA